MSKHVFLFSETDIKLGRDRLGGKGFGLIQMRNLGLPVPEGFVITTEVCREYFKELHDLSGTEITEEIKEALVALVKASGRNADEVTVSIRSGAQISMPGMMDTKLNFKITDFPGLLMEIRKVFDSWNSPRAKKFREMNKIPDDLGTACVVQLMVSGKGYRGGTGVVFSRNPETGEKVLFGEWLKNSQGDALVSGVLTPFPIEKLGRATSFREPYLELVKDLEILEKHFKDMQEVEFTIEEGKLWLLQTRSGIRTPQAARKIAFDLLQEKIIDAATFEARLAVVKEEKPPIEAPCIWQEPSVKGTPSSGGIVAGVVATSCEKAVELRDQGQEVILVREETTSLDLVGMEASVGVVTAIGGVTSHAAVVGRGLGLAVVVGCGSGLFELGLKDGDPITIDGKKGFVWNQNLLKEKAA